jgi:hypothetical protein
MLVQDRIYFFRRTHFRRVAFGWLGGKVGKLEREGGLGIDHQVGC